MAADIKHSDSIGGIDPTVPPHEPSDWRSPPILFWLWFTESIVLGATTVWMLDLNSIWPPAVSPFIPLLWAVFVIKFRFWINGENQYIFQKMRQPGFPRKSVIFCIVFFTLLELFLATSFRSMVKESAAAAGGHFYPENSRELYIDSH